MAFPRCSGLAVSPQVELKANADAELAIWQRKHEMKTFFRVWIALVET